jgi:hypothetical protein
MEAARTEQLAMLLELLGERETPEATGQQAAREAIALVSAGAQELLLYDKKLKDAGAAALAEVMATNTTLKEVLLVNNLIGPVGT